MNRRFFIAWIVTFIAWMAGSYAVHGAFVWIYARGIEAKPWLAQLT